MKLSIDKSFVNTSTGYATAFILLLICYFLIFSTNRKLRDQGDNVAHTYQVIDNLEKVLSYLKDAETGVRGYWALKDPVFLEPYYKSIKIKDDILGDLKTLTAYNSLEQQRLDSLNQLMVQRFIILKAGLDTFETNNENITPSLQVLAYKGKEVMDTIRSLIERMQTYEIDSLTATKNSLQSFRSAVTVINVTSFALAILLILYSLITYLREHRLKNAAAKAALISQQGLESTVRDMQEVTMELIELRRNEKFAVTGRIARTIAHEVKNPLTNITLAAEQLKEFIPESEESKMMFDMISRNSNRINHLVSDLLNSTKVSELKFDKVSVEELLNEALEMAKDRIELNNIKVQRKYSSGLCHINVDRDQIKTAFLNIIVNAVEAMEPGKGILLVKTESRNNKCVITISDNGIGMKVEELLRLFEPYFTNKPKGTGLGLTHTQNIIISHKGLINVASKPGLGTSFEITIDFAE